MAAENEHSACVNSWMAWCAQGLPAARLLRAFDAAFAVVWRRAHQTLGDVTLTAIADRVLYVAAEKYPVFASLEVDAKGLRCEELHQRADSLRNEQLAEGVQFILVEFLTVLGNLTDDILTPALHGELSKIAPASDDSVENRPADERQHPESKDGEGSKP